MAKTAAQILEVFSQLRSRAQEQAKEEEVKKAKNADWTERDFEVTLGDGDSSFGIGFSGSLLITKVTDGLPTDRAGVPKGCTVVKVDGADVSTLAEFAGLMKGKRSVTLRCRKGAPPPAATAGAPAPAAAGAPAGGAPAPLPPPPGPPPGYGMQRPPPGQGQPPSGAPSGMPPGFPPPGSMPGLPPPAGTPPGFPPPARMPPGFPPPAGMPPGFPPPAGMPPGFPPPGAMPPGAMPPGMPPNLPPPGVLPPSMPPGGVPPVLPLPGTPQGFPPPGAGIPPPPGAFGGLPPSGAPPSGAPPGGVPPGGPLPTPAALGLRTAPAPDSGAQGRPAGELPRPGGLATEPLPAPGSLGGAGMAGGLQLPATPAAAAMAAAQGRGAQAAAPFRAVYSAPPRAGLPLPSPSVGAPPKLPPGPPPSGPPPPLQNRTAVPQPKSVSQEQALKVPEQPKQPPQTKDPVQAGPFKLSDAATARAEELGKWVAAVLNQYPGERARSMMLVKDLEQQDRELFGVLTESGGKPKALAALRALSEATKVPQFHISPPPEFWVSAKAVQPRAPPPRAYKCKRCGQTGHWTDDCGPSRSPSPDVRAVPTLAKSAPACRLSGTPQRPPAVGSPKAGSAKVRVTKAPGAPLEATFDHPEAPPVLRQASGILAAAGANAFVGRLVTHVNGTPVANPVDIARLAESLGVMELAFAPAAGEAPGGDALDEMMDTVLSAMDSPEEKKKPKKRKRSRSGRSPARKPKRSRDSSSPRRRRRRRSRSKQRSPRRGRRSSGSRRRKSTDRRRRDRSERRRSQSSHRDRQRSRSERRARRSSSPQRPSRGGRRNSAERSRSPKRADGPRRSTTPQRPARRRNSRSPKRGGSPRRSTTPQRPARRRNSLPSRSPKRGGSPRRSTTPQRPARRNSSAELQRRRSVKQADGPRRSITPQQPARRRISRSPKRDGSRSASPKRAPRGGRQPLSPGAQRRRQRSQSDGRVQNRGRGGKAKRRDRSRSGQDAGRSEAAAAGITVGSVVSSGRRIMLRPVPDSTNRPRGAPKVSAGSLMDVLAEQAEFVRVRQQGVNDVTGWVKREYLNVHEAAEQEDALRRKLVQSISAGGGCAGAGKRRCSPSGNGSESRPLRHGGEVRRRR